MPPPVTCASAQPSKTGNTEIAFLTRCVSALPEFNQSLLDFFTLLHDSVNLVINAFSLGLLRPWFRRKEVESATEVGLCCTHYAPVRCFLGFLFRKVMLKH